MRTDALFPLVFGLLVLAGNAGAQMDLELSGVLAEWSLGEAEIVLLPPRYMPPPFIRPDDALRIGTVSADGDLSIVLPEAAADEDSVPVVSFLEPNGCANAELTPDDARFSMTAFGVYQENGSLIGEIFKGSAGAGRGPVPGEYTILIAHAPVAFDLQASCPDPGRRVEERYEYEATPGWHEVVQTFEHHPDEAGWRLDRWQQRAAPDDARWVLIRPPG